MPRLALPIVLISAAGLLGTTAAPQADIAPLYAEVVRTGWLRVPGVGFAPGASTPTEASGPAMARVLALLKEHTEWTFEVQVHVAGGATAAADQGLSDARAETLVRWWRDRGVARERLVARGEGRSGPPPGEGAPADRVELRKLNEE